MRFGKTVCLPARGLARRHGPSALVSALALAGVLSGAGMTAKAQGAVAAVAEPSGVLSLSTSATREVEHDLMSIVFSTSRDGADANAVQAGLRQALDAALAEARRAARPRELEVETGNFSLYPRPATKTQPAGWQGSAQLRVQGRDMAAISQLAGRIQSMSIANVGYGLSRERREQVEGELAAQAVQRFRSQAADYAKLFGYAGFVVRDVNVNGSDNAPQVPMYRARTMSMAAVADESLPVEAGKGSVSVNVGGSVQMTR